MTNSCTLLDMDPALRIRISIWLHVRGHRRPTFVERRMFSSQERVMHVRCLATHPFANNPSRPTLIFPTSNDIPVNVRKKEHMLFLRWTCRRVTAVSWDPHKYQRKYPCGLHETWTMHAVDHNHAHLYRSFVSITNILARNKPERVNDSDGHLRKLSAGEHFVDGICVVCQLRDTACDSQQVGPSSSNGFNAGAVTSHSTSLQHNERTSSCSQVISHNLLFRCVCTDPSNHFRVADYHTNTHTTDFASWLAGIFQSSLASSGLHWNSLCG